MSFMLVDRSRPTGCGVEGAVGALGRLSELLFCRTITWCWVVAASLLLTAALLALAVTLLVEVLLVPIRVVVVEATTRVVC